jgi:hypothetical protein
MWGIFIKNNLFELLFIKFDCKSTCHSCSKKKKIVEIQ